MTTPGIRRYLDRYAEEIATESRTELNDILGPTYQSVLAIPLFDETHNCLDTILPEGIHNTLVIVIVNAAVDSDPGAIQRTQTFLDQFHPHSQSPLTVIHQPAGNTLLLIDCCTDGRLLPKKQGVGLARKIGGDIALACIADQIVESPWIHCTDGDVQLPKDYFEIPILDPEVAVAIYPFCHRPLHEDILAYEISLRYYVMALAQAGSPYSFQSIGSLLKINASHYAMVRGFPKRQAAEDFYMLNKLAKTGKVIRLKQPQVTLSSRISRRVPFGTGAAMARLSSDPALLLYHPQIFVELRTWLELDQLLWTEFGGNDNAPTDITSRLQEWWQQQNLSDSLLQTLLYLKVDHALGQAFQQCRDFSRFQFFLRVWFDAFRTLKFVHYQREHYWPSLTIQAAMTLFWSCPPSTTASPANMASKQDFLPSSPDFLDILAQLCREEIHLSTEIGPTLSLSS